MEQEVRGSIPGLATTISEIGYLLLPSRDMVEIPPTRRKSSVQLIIIFIFEIQRLKWEKGKYCIFLKVALIYASIDLKRIFDVPITLCHCQIRRSKNLHRDEKLYLWFLLCFILNIFIRIVSYQCHNISDYPKQAYAYFRV